MVRRIYKSFRYRLGEYLQRRRVRKRFRSKELTELEREFKRAHREYLKAVQEAERRG